MPDRVSAGQGETAEQAWDGCHDDPITPEQAHAVAANWRNTTQLSNALDAIAFEAERLLVRVQEADEGNKKLMVALVKRISERDRAELRVRELTDERDEALKLAEASWRTAWQKAQREWHSDAVEKIPALEARVQEAERAQRDEKEMSAQVVATLQDLYTNWRRIVDEQDDDGGPLIENLLYWAIEDLGGGGDGQQEQASDA